jgi:hypothetical protein
VAILLPPWIPHGIRACLSFSLFPSFCLPSVRSPSPFPSSPTHRSSSLRFFSPGEMHQTPPGQIPSGRMRQTPPGQMSSGQMRQIPHGQMPSRQMRRIPPLFFSLLFLVHFSSSTKFEVAPVDLNLDAPHLDLEPPHATQIGINDTWWQVSIQVQTPI